MSSRPPRGGFFVSFDIESEKVMKADFPGALAFVLQAEGGYSDDHDDPGGATNLGIEQTEYNLWRRAEGLSVQSVKLITQAEASAIYAANYWSPVHCDYIETPIAYALFNYSVNTGVSQSIKFLQGVLGITQSGDWDSATSAAYWTWLQA